MDGSCVNGATGVDGVTAASRGRSTRMRRRAA